MRDLDDLIRDETKAKHVFCYSLMNPGGEGRTVTLQTDHSKAVLTADSIMELVLTVEYPSVNSRVGHTVLFIPFLPTVMLGYVLKYPLDTSSFYMTQVLW